MQQFASSPVAKKAGLRPMSRGHYMLTSLRQQFPTARVADLEKIPLQLQDPVKYRYRSILFVADDNAGRVKEPGRGRASKSRDAPSLFSSLHFLCGIPICKV